MKSLLKSGIILTIATAALPVMAEERVNAFQDWAVYEESNPKTCWISSSPQKTENSRDGKPRTVTRGEIVLSVSYQADKSIVGEVSFAGGYPFDPDRYVKMTIGTQSFDLRPVGETAWPENPSVDQTVRVAMTKGATAVLTARSTRNTDTKDTFSLKGFTAALNDAKQRCGI
ncbi:hypothetical protein GCM10007939_17260 [Amylibacter marinus]|uniref:Invasion protein IalB, involved in pathogenesis n=1 Tax=Amylibacter marinus TaxID=1475483 RepID=A0ABQ5VWG9_9RHOB|nr:invasion associated locus B family protein [Amylibacter marinus]GLQ35443.1 hypothetical protein GCM10007939_17260 [Amylibacter marinus]